VIAIARSSSDARDNIPITRWSETAEALRKYYARYLVPSRVPSDDSRPKSILRERDAPAPAMADHPAEQAADETPTTQEPSAPSEDLGMDIVSAPPCPITPILADPAECKNTPRPTKVKVEASDFYGPQLPSILPCARRLNQTHLDELFPTDGNQPVLVCTVCMILESHYECPADTPLEELSAHVEKHHPEFFEAILEKTKGMTDEEIVEWFKGLDG